MIIAPSASDFLVGLPAGLLIVMGTALFSTLLSLASGRDISSSWAGLVVLAVTSFITGAIAGLIRKNRGPATALCAGITAALILLFLRLASGPADTYNHLVFGIIGTLMVIFCCIPGGLWGARLRGVK